MHVAQKGSTDFTASKPPSDLVVSTLVWREQMTAQSMQPTGNTTVSPVQLADQQPSAVVLAQLDTSNTQPGAAAVLMRSEEHTSELQSLAYLVCRLLLEKKKKKQLNKLQHDLEPSHQL